MTEITLIKRNHDTYTPATETDREIGVKWKIGLGIKFDAVKHSSRSLQHHKLYWGGLIELAFHYWEPEGGLISESEVKTLSMFANWLDRKGGNTGAIRNAQEAFLSELSESRGKKIETPEKTKSGLHEWIKREAGLFDYEITPRGIAKKTRSINFNSMSQEEFSEFYKSAFSVVWKFILSRSFGCESEAQNAIDQLIAMG